MKKKILNICIVMTLIILVLPIAGINIVKNEVSGTSTMVKKDPSFIVSTTVDWWPMFHHDPQHSGLSSSTAPNTKHILWTFKAKNECSFYGSAAVVNDRVYTATIGVNNGFPGLTKITKNNYSGKVYCLDANTGEVIWQYTSRYGTWATPAVANGKVYVCSGLWWWSFDNITLDHVGDVFCLDATNGNLLWEYRDCQYVIGGPVITDGKLYFGSFNDSNGWVWCFNASNGQKLWNYECNDPIGPVTVVNGKVYVSIRRSYDKFLCLNATTGEMIWTWNEGYIEEIYAGSSVAEGRVYVATMGYGYIDPNGTYWVPGDLHCLDAETGTLLWEANLGTGFTWGSPAVAYGNVYIGTGDGLCNTGKGGFYCVNASTGNLVWKHDGLFPEQGKYLAYSGSLSPAIADGKVYFGCESVLFNNCFFCLDAFTGKTLWTYRNFAINKQCSNVAIANGKVYVGFASCLFGLTGSLICFN